MYKFIAMLILFLCANSVLAGLFTDHVNEIQVYEDRVRIHIGRGYGTCAEREGWFGWSASDPRHNDWLSLALMAKASKVKVSMYDEGNSCNGLSDAVKVEGIFLPVVE